MKTRYDVLETFKIFIALVKDRKYSTAFQKPSRVSPIEFTMTGVLIYHYKKTHSLLQLSNAILRPISSEQRHELNHGGQKSKLNQIPGNIVQSRQLLSLLKRI